MSMKKALQVVSTGIFFKIMLPEWGLGLTKKLETIKIAFDELQVRSTKYFL